MIKIRFATMKDMKKIRNLCDRVRVQLHENGIDMWDEDYPNEEIFGEDIQRKNLIVAVDGRKIIGSISFNFDLKTELFFDVEDEKACEAEISKLLASCLATKETIMSLHRLMVHPDHQRQGIATRLIQEAEKQALGKTIILFTEANNQKAINLYLRLGYTRNGMYTFTFGSLAYMYKKA
jgi:ribosomal protein S18 acetylase RimI-like enzyme